MVKVDGPYTEQGMTIKVITPFKPILMYQQNILDFTDYFSFRTSTRGNQVTYIDEFFKNLKNLQKKYFYLFLSIPEYTLFSQKF